MEILPPHRASDCVVLDIPERSISPELILATNTTNNSEEVQDHHRRLPFSRRLRSFFRPKNLTLPFENISANSSHSLTEAREQTIDDADLYYGPKVLEFYLPVKLPSKEQVLENLLIGVLNDIYLGSFSTTTDPFLRQHPRNEFDLKQPEIDSSKIETTPLKCMVMLDKSSVLLNCNNKQESEDNLNLQEKILIFDIFSDCPCTIDIFFGLKESHDSLPENFTFRSKITRKIDTIGKVNVAVSCKEHLGNNDLTVTGLSEHTKDPRKGTDEGWWGTFKNTFWNTAKQGTTEKADLECNSELSYEWPVLILLTPFIIGEPILTQGSFLTLTHDMPTLVKQKFYLKEYSFYISEIYDDNQTSNNASSSSDKYQESIREWCRSPGKISILSAFSGSISNQGGAIGKGSCTGSSAGVASPDKKIGSSPINTPPLLSAPTPNTTSGYFSFLKKSFKQERTAATSSINSSPENTSDLLPTMLAAPTPRSIAVSQSPELHNSECVICMSRKTTFCVLFPCRHTSLCEECLIAYIHVPPSTEQLSRNNIIPRFKDCPLCRHPIMSALSLQ